MTRMTRVIAIVGLVALIVMILSVLFGISQAHAQFLGTWAKDRQGVPAPPSSYQPNPTNTSQTGAANTAVTQSLGATATQKWKIETVSAFCTAGAGQITITNSGVTVFSTDTAFVGSKLVSLTWVPALTGAISTGMVITLGSCGGGGSGTLNVAADLF